MSYILALGADKIRHHMVEKRYQKEAAASGMADKDLAWCHEDLINRLKRNEIETLSLGWKDSDFSYHRSARKVTALEKALLVNTSVRHVSLGWRVHHKRREILVRILKALSSKSHNGKLLSLQLVLDDWIPEATLKNLLSSQRHLVTIEIGAVQVMRRNAVGHVCCAAAAASQRAATESARLFVATHSSSVAPSTTVASVSRNSNLVVPSGQYGPVVSEFCCDHNVASRIFGKVDVNHYITKLKSLSLEDCNLTDASAEVLADALHLRGGIANLSLRNNRHLGKRGLALLCQAPVMDKLDFGICDLDTDETIAVAHAVARRPWVLGELVLAGNYRMDTDGLLALVSTQTCRKLRALDVSFCDVGDHRATAVLTALRQLSTQTALHTFIMQGGRIVCAEATQALCDLLLENTPLRTLRINHPRSPQYVSTAQLNLILTSLRENYELEYLDVDIRVETVSDIDIQREMDIYFRLNKAGRRILRPNEFVASLPPRAGSNKTSDKPDWYTVVANAGTDLNVVYWMVRQSADYFASWQ